MENADPNYRVAIGVKQARLLQSSLFEQPGPKPDVTYGIANVDMLERLFLEYSLEYANPDRLKANIPIRFIYTSVKGPIYSRSDKRLLRESRFLTPQQLGGCADLSIVGDTVVFMSYSPQVVARAITSLAVASQMLAFFNVLWDSASS